MTDKGRTKLGVGLGIVTGMAFCVGILIYPGLVMAGFVALAVVGAVVGICALFGWMIAEIINES